MKIYLAGKIAKTDWRHDLVGYDLRAADGNADWRDERIRFWGHHEYVGPFFVGCDHGCSHFLGEHGITRNMCEENYQGDHGDGWWQDETGEAPERKYRGPSSDIASGVTMVVDHRRLTLMRRCREAIDSADLVFCWLDTESAHGSIWELGYAIGVGVRVVVAMPNGFDASDLWLSVYGASSVVRSDSPRNAFTEVLGQILPPSKSESPIEESMLLALRRVLPAFVQIEQQEPLCGGKYRVDFALTTPVGDLVVVECDGHDFHEKTKEQAARDKKRDRDLQIEGWHVLRFTGSEIHRDADRCAADVRALICPNGIAAATAANEAARMHA